MAAVLALASLNYRGVTKTVLLTRVLAATSLTALAVVVVGIAVGGRADPANLGGWQALGTGGPYGILQAPACCSSRSPATPGSRPWARRSAIRSAPSPGPS